MPGLCWRTYEKFHFVAPDNSRLGKSDNCIITKFRGGGNRIELCRLRRLRHRRISSAERINNCIRLIALSLRDKSRENPAENSSHSPDLTGKYKNLLENQFQSFPVKFSFSAGKSSRCLKIRPTFSTGAFSSSIFVHRRYVFFVSLVGCSDFLRHFPIFFLKFH